MIWSRLNLCFLMFISVFSARSLAQENVRAYEVHGKAVRFVEDKENLLLPR